VLGELDLASQSVFAGRYRVVRRIASGGMGAVFEVVHLETQRRRALKVMLPELLANQQLRERFLMEAKITANVETEYIVDVFDAGIDSATGMPFLVMELLNGHDLGKVLEDTGPLTPEQVVSYLRQVGSALDKTHRAGIVHRDLKPENLFLTHREDGSPRVKILDFGISKVVTEATTGVGATRGIGTPLYMAPEQVLAQTVSAATDLYALGLIAYTLLVGVPYWQSDVERFDNPISFVVHTSKGVTDSASSRAQLSGRSLPTGFDAWFRQATHLNSTSRFRSASELVSALAAVLGVAMPPSIGSPLGADSTGSIARQVAAPSAATMVARTAPGTELDRTSTSSGSSRPSKVTLVLGLGLAVAVAAAVMLLILRPRSHAAATAEPREPSAEPSATAAEEPKPASNFAPSAATAAAPAPSAEPSPSTAPAKSAAIGNGGAPAKNPVAGARPGRSRLYTRD
jgi:serine/threonine-protein kinase